MRCQRCHGLMVVDSFMDMQDGEGGLWLRALRCVNCGEVEDPGIRRNRLASRSRFARLFEQMTRKPQRTVETVRLSA